MTACPRCARTATPGVVPEGRARVGPLTVGLAPVPVTTCPAGHRLPRSDLDEALPAGVLRAVLVGDRAGMRRREVCGDCRADLSLPPRPSETPVPVEVPGGVVTVTLEGPMVRCPECGRDQLPRTVADRLRPAVAAALGFAVDRPA